MGRCGAYSSPNRRHLRFLSGVMGTDVNVHATSPRATLYFLWIVPSRVIWHRGLRDVLSYSRKMYYEDIMSRSKCHLWPWRKREGQNQYVNKLSDLKTNWVNHKATQQEHRPNFHCSLSYLWIFSLTWAHNLYFLTQLGLSIMYNKYYSYDTIPYLFVLTANILHKGFSFTFLNKKAQPPIFSGRIKVKI